MKKELRLIYDRLEIARREKQNEQIDVEIAYRKIELRLLQQELDKRKK